MMRRLSVVLLMFVTLAIATPAIHLPTSAAQLDPAIRDRVTAAAIQVGVTVSWIEGGEVSYFPMPVGSGTIVTADGLVLTNHHVVEPISLNELIASWQHQISQEHPDVILQRVGADFVLLGSDGRSPPRRLYFADLIAAVPAPDIAVLRIRDHADDERFGEPVTTATPFIEFGDSDDVLLGDRVQIFAYPAIGGDSLTYTVGVISSFDFDDDTGERKWISTDAVMSGGSSGGTAINDAGLLIGIPTGGSQLDCREGDTNRDGVIDEKDVGCIPTGGSLGQLIPINEAVALLERKGIDIAQVTVPDAGSSDPTPIPTTDLGWPTVMPTATTTPLPPVTATPSPTRAPVTASTTCSFAFDQWFSDPDSVQAFDEVDRWGYVGDGALKLGIRSPGATIIYAYDQCGTNGAPASFNVSFKETVGWGELMVLILTDDGSEWVFNFDPQTEMWSMYRTSDETGQFFYWIEPISYVSDYAYGFGKGQYLMSVFATEDSVRLLINGTTVANSADGILPEMTGNLMFGFGIGINPNSLSGSGQTFEAAIDRVTLTHLR